LKFTRKSKIKILNKDGLDIANRSVSLYREGLNREKLTKLKVTTYKLENGKVESYKMSNDNEFEESISDNLDKVFFNAVQVGVGDIVEIEYSIISDFLFNLQPWDFQSMYPVEYSRYKVLLPEYFNYNKSIHGYIKVESLPLKGENQKFTIQYDNRHTQFGNSGDRGSYDINSHSTLHTYVAREVEAFREEPYLSSARNFMSSIKFELLSVKFPYSTVDVYSRDWASIDKQFLEHKGFGGYISDRNDGRYVLEQLQLQGNTPEEIVLNTYLSILQYVKFNGKLRTLTNSSLRDVFKQGEGSSAEINLMLVNLLNQQGVESYPVVASTRDHGMVRTSYASLSQFNHVVAAVIIDSSLVFMDASCASCLPGTLPFRTLNGTARLVHPSQRGWVNLSSTQKGITSTAVVARLSESEWSANVQRNFSGYHAFLERLKVNNEGSSEEYIAALANDYSNYKISNPAMNGFEAPEQDLMLTMDIHSGSIEKLGSKLLITPSFMFSFSDNPFKSENRTYPVDFGYRQAENYSITYHLPDNYHMDANPEPARIVLPDGKGSFMYQVIKVGKMIQVQFRYELNESMYSSEDYPLLKQFFSLMIDKINEPLVLDKQS